MLKSAPRTFLAVAFLLTPLAGSSLADDTLTTAVRMPSALQQAVAMQRTAAVQRLGLTAVSPNVRPTLASPRADEPVNRIEAAKAAHYRAAAGVAARTLASAHRGQPAGAVQSIQAPDSHQQLRKLAE